MMKRSLIGQNIFLIISMAKYPAEIYEPREKESRSGVVYDPTKKTVIFVEDVKGLDDEVVAIEKLIGQNVDGQTMPIAGGFLKGKANGQSKWSTEIFVNENGRVGIGTTNPVATLHIVTNSEGLRIESTSQAYISLDTAYDSISGSLLRFRKARGSISAPAVVQENDTLGFLSFRGYDGVGYQYAADVIAKADGTPGVGSMPGRLEFATTPSGSTVTQIRMVIKNNGNVGIGTTSPSQKLEVNGAIKYTPISAPSNPTAGTVYYDSSENKLKVYNGSAWETISSS